MGLETFCQSIVASRSAPDTGGVLNCNAQRDRRRRLRLVSSFLSTVALCLLNINSLMHLPVLNIGTPRNAVQLIGAGEPLSIPRAGRLQT